MNIAARSIDYRLNILGVRVWESECQLISRRGTIWFPMGPIQKLPITLPRLMEELKAALADEVYITATQFQIENSTSDIAAVLSKQKEFKAALAETSEKVS